MKSPTLFCPNCQRYLGASDGCIFCGWARLSTERIPSPGQINWKLTTSHPPDGQPFAWGDSLLLADQSGLLTAVRAVDGLSISKYDCGERLRPGWVWQHTSLSLATRSGEVISLRLPESPSSFEKAKDMRREWLFALRGSAGGLAGADNNLFLGDGEGNVFALCTTENQAEILWQTDIGQRIAAPPNIWRHLLLIATQHPQGQLFALETRTGNVIWHQTLGGRGMCAPLILNQPAGRNSRDLAVTATDRGKLRAFILPDGDPFEWSFHVEEELSTLPQAWEDTVFLGTISGQCLALKVPQTTPAWTINLGEKVTGLAYWKGLLFTGTLSGTLSVLNAKTGKIGWHWTVPGGIISGPFVIHDQIIVASPQGWLALPWHLGHWGWAADFCQEWCEASAAADFFALDGNAAEAERIWMAQNRPALAARLWAALGDDLQAAQAYERAADKQRQAYPTEAAAHLNRAADHYELCGKSDQSQTCRSQASRIGTSPYLKLELLNMSLEAGTPGKIALKIWNTGNSPAHDVHFRLGGRLAFMVKGALELALKPGTVEVLEFENLIATTSGKQQLTVSLVYHATGGTVLNGEAILELDVLPPPPGLITIADDAGIVHVRVPEGSPLPTVRAGGMVAKVEYEIVPATPSDS